MTKVRLSAACDDCPEASCAGCVLAIKGDVGPQELPPARARLGVPGMRPKRWNGKNVETGEVKRR